MAQKETREFEPPQRDAPAQGSSTAPPSGDGHYRSVFTAMPEGFALQQLILDEQGRPYDYRFLEVNPAFVRLSELDASQLVGRTIREVFPDVDQLWIDRYARVALTGEPARFEHFSNRLNRWIEFYAYPADTGQFVVLLTDITERKRALQALQASEEHLRLLFDQAVDGIFVSNAEGRYIDVNASGCQMLGYARDELLRLSIPDILMPEDRPRLEAELALLRQGEVAHSAWRFQRKDGSCFDGEVVGRQLPDGRLQAFLRDVAERTRELTTSTALVQRISDDSHLLMAHLDTDLRYIRVNRAFADASGRGLQAHCGVRHFNLHPNDDREAVFRRVLETGKPHSAFSEPFFGAEGPYSSWDWTLQPLRGPDNKITGLLLALLDASARVRLDNELERIEQREMQTISAELHDTVGQQLTAIGYMLDNLEIDPGARGIEGKLQELRSAVREADAQVRCLSRGLNPAQLGTGGLPGALEDLAARIERRFGVACSCTCPDSVELEDVAATQILRVAQEAVNNAVRHAKPKCITIRVETGDGWTTLTVSDDGIGIPPTVQEGGLGLRIMTHRAGALGGKVSVRPGDAGGTIVVLSVPESKT